jgi:ribosomal-protein-alanine N-acetyltransferase
MPVITETPRLIIRTFQPEEEEAYLALFSDERVAEHLPKRTIEENRKIFLDTLKEDAAGATFSKWAIINKADGDLAGMGLLRTYENEPDKLEVGYCLHVKYWGQGIATELSKALITYANNHGVKNIVAVTTPGNTASQVVLEKAGLLKQGNIVRNNEELVFFKM